MATHVHVYLKKRVQDQKFKIAYSGQTLEGKKEGFTMEVTAPDTYTASAIVSEEAAKRYKGGLYYPKIIFGSASRLPANSKSLKIAKRAGPEEEEGTTDADQRGYAKRMLEAVQLEKAATIKRLALYVTTWGSTDPVTQREEAELARHVENERLWKRLSTMNVQALTAMQRKGEIPSSAFGYGVRDGSGKA